MDIKNIFDDEDNILPQIDELLHEANKLSTDSLVDLLKTLTKKYKSAQKQSEKLSKISDAQGKELIKEQLELRNILDNSSQGFLTINDNYRVGKTYSLECEKIFEKKIDNENYLNLVNLGDEQNNNSLKLTIDKVFQGIKNNDFENHLKLLPKNFNIANKNIEASYRIIKKINDSDEYLIMIILTDITEKIKDKEKIIYLNTHDKLTGLYNRSYISLIEDDLYEKSDVGIIFGDVNGLKLTNDVFGHEKGDELLVLISSIMSKSCWKNEILVRWAGDEFIIIVSNATNKICKDLIQRIKSSCAVTKWEPIAPSISFGYSIQKKNERFDLSKLFNIAEKNMYINKLEESKSVKKLLISNIEQILIDKCFESKEHMTNMEDMLIRFANKVGNLKTPIEVAQAKLAVRLHDAGKVTISTDLLNKQEELSSDDWIIIKAHSEIGYRMLQSIGEHTVANIVLYTHERWDGTGYPHNLSKEQIPELSRMISIVETYDRLTNYRTYKDSLEKEEAFKELELNSGTQFDPILVKIFIEEFK